MMILGTNEASVRKIWDSNIFQTNKQIETLLVKLKDRTGKENVVGPVYKIKCEECDSVYVDETERSLKTRFSEHR